MSRRILFITFCFVLLVCGWSTTGAQAWGVNTSSTAVNQTPLIEVATSPRYLWNGVAVSPNNRVFVSFPRWLDDNTPAVGEILKDKSIQPFPGGGWNESSSLFAKERFVNVNSVFASDNYLWVVDSGAPHGRVVPDGPKLVQIDLDTNKVKRVYYFDKTIAPEQSYIDDVRLDSQHAYLTEAGLGAIIVVDLKSGKARRLLENHPSTHASPSIVPVIQGKELRDEKGEVPQIHVNDLELSPDGKYLYYQPTAGPNLYRIQTKFLLDENMTDSELSEKVELVGKSMVLGGMSGDRLGNLYLCDIEHNAIRVRRPNGNLELIVQDDRIQWCDAGSMSEDGYFYFPVPQIHRTPAFNNGIDRTQKPYKLFKVKIIDN